jgi:hypothetical protein
MSIRPTAYERKVLMTTTFVAACICFAPGEFVAGGILLFVTLAQAARHRQLSTREASEAKAARSVAAAPAEEDRDDDDPSVAGHLGT